MWAELASFGDVRRVDLDRTRIQIGCMYGKKKIREPRERAISAASGGSPMKTAVERVTGSVATRPSPRSRVRLTLGLA